MVHVCPMCVCYFQRLGIHPGIVSSAFIRRAKSCTTALRSFSSESNTALGIPTSLLLSIWSCQTSAMAPWKDLDCTVQSSSVSFGDCTGKSKDQSEKTCLKLLKTCFAKENTTEHLAHHLLPPDLVWICRMLHQPWSVKAGNFFRYTPYYTVGHRIPCQQVRTQSLKKVSYVRNDCAELSGTRLKS